MNQTLSQSKNKKQIKPSDQIKEKNSNIIYYVFNQFINSVCKKKQIYSHFYAKILSLLNHLNIINGDEYQTISNYFIKIEKYESPLQDFIKKNYDLIIDEKQTIILTLQIIYSIQYLLQNNYFQRNISFKYVLIVIQKQIKQYQFESAQRIQINQKFKYLEKQKSNLNLYFPPKILELSNQVKSNANVSQNIQGNIYQFAVSLHILAGIDFSRPKQFRKNVQSYQIQKFDLEIILQDIIQRNSLTIYNILEKFNYIKTKKAIQTEQKIFKFVKQCFDNFEFQQSINSLEILIEANPYNDEYIAMLGRAYLEIYKIDEAFNQSLKCQKINPQNELSMSNLGYCYYQNEDYENSFKYIDKCLSINSNNYLALNYKAHILNNQNKLDEAIQIYEQVLKINPNYIHAIQGIGRAYMSQRKYDQSIDYYQKVQKIKPDYMNLYIEIACAYLQQNMRQQALDVLKEGLEIVQNSSSWIWFHYQGFYYQILEQYDSSIDYYKKSLQAQTKFNYQSNFRLGEIYIQKRQFDLALSQFQKYQQFYTKQPSFNIEILDNIGIIYYSQNKYEKALCYFKQVLKINPHHVNANNQIGIIYSIYQKQDLAYNYYKKALKINPNNEVLYSNLQTAKKKI